MRDTGLEAWGSLHPQDIHYRGVASKCAGSPLSATSIELPLRSPGALPGWPPSTSVLRVFFSLSAQASCLRERPCVSMCPCRSVQDSGCLVYVLHTCVCLCTCLRGGGCSCEWVWVCAGCVSARVGMCGAGGRAARRGARALSENRGRGRAGRSGAWLRRGFGPYLRGAEGKRRPERRGAGRARPEPLQRRRAERGDPSARCPDPGGSGWAMEAPWRRGGLAALWYLGLLASLAHVAGTHYRYLWRGCYPCHLGQAGYPVNAGDPRPGGSGGLCAGRAGCALSRVSCLCFLLHSLHPERLMPRLEGAGLGQTGRQPLPLGQGHSRPVSGLAAWAADSISASRPEGGEKYSNCVCRWAPGPHFPCSTSSSEG